MFADADSESDRPGSPWDVLLSSSPASLDVESKMRLRGTPRLTPEIEEGNVEYKLKLVEPTPERFMRLVTQLKWRLLEGGGQAYYELGVADSGQLVGLSKRQMDQSLETLEAMAGEIGASVIVVKEVEVLTSGPDDAPGPPIKTLKETATGVRGAVDFSRVDGSLRLPRRRVLPLLGPGDSDGDADTPGDSTEAETDDVSSRGNDNGSGHDTGLGGASPVFTAFELDASQSHSAQASPALEPQLDIEIATVFKPLPSLRRELPPGAPLPLKPRKEKPTTKVHELPMDPVQRAQQRRQKRDQRREEKRKQLDDGLVPEKNVATLAVPGSKKRGIDKDKELDDDAEAESGPPGPRIIVEALVVRKLTTDEAFLDLNSFVL